MSIVNIKGFDKAEVLLALYINSHCQGMGFLSAVDNFTIDDARNAIQNNPDMRFDYLHGRVLKVNLSGDSFESWGYDRDNGEGAAQKAVDQILNELEKTETLKQLDEFVNGSDGNIETTKKEDAGGGNEDVGDDDGFDPADDDD